MKYETGPYKKPKGLLTAQSVKRKTPKSAFLRAIEKRQRSQMREVRHEQEKAQRLYDIASVRLLPGGQI